MNEILQKELTDFLFERLKYYMKEKEIRNDIIEASINSNNLNNMNKLFKKGLTLNNVIKKQIGEDIVYSYKRAYNIIENELKNENIELSNKTDPGIFKNDYEVNLLKKIDELKKYFTGIDRDENYLESLSNLAAAKK